MWLYLIIKIMFVGFTDNTGTSEAHETQSDDEVVLGLERSWSSRTRIA